ncbi:MAG: hypothetical protein IJU66_09440 [Oscillospiraceae bacterium]|nr:hypothetical protein [Oscillospiraceae bacterium]
MECVKYKAEMFPARLFRQFAPVYPVSKKPGPLGEEKRGGVSCFACPACGYIELKADDPGALRFSY